MLYKNSDSKDRPKTDKIRSMTKTRSSDIFGVEMEMFFLKEVIQICLVREIFFVPPNLAPSLLLCIYLLPTYTVYVYRPTRVYACIRALKS